VKQTCKVWGMIIWHTDCTDVSKFHFHILLLWVLALYVSAPWWWQLRRNMQELMRS